MIEMIALSPILIQNACCVVQSSLGRSGQLADPDVFGEAGSGHRPQAGSLGSQFNRGVQYAVKPPGSTAVDSGKMEVCLLNAENVPDG